LETRYGGTVEFRQHSGTTNFGKIARWVMLSQAIMSKAWEMHEQRKNVFEHRFSAIDQELKLGPELTGWIKLRTEELVAAQEAQAQQRERERSTNDSTMGNSNA
jgi:hypothetical protein